MSNHRGKLAGFSTVWPSFRQTLGGTTGAEKRKPAAITAGRKTSVQTTRECEVYVE